MNNYPYRDIFEFFLSILKSLFSSMFFLFWGLSGLIFFQVLVFDNSYNPLIVEELIVVSSTIIRNWKLVFFSSFFLDVFLIFRKTKEEGFEK